MNMCVINVQRTAHSPHTHIGPDTFIDFVFCILSSSGVLPVRSNEESGKRMVDDFTVFMVRFGSCL